MAAVPTRMCRVCRAKKPQAELVRWTLAAEGPRADTGRRRPGRGYYTCSQGCAERLGRTINRPRKR